MAYITSDEARAGMFDRRDEFTGLTGTTITIRSGNAQKIISIKKNGNATSAYTFTPPRTITLNDAAITSDKFEVHSGILYEDAEINRVLDEVDDYIKGQISKRYTLPLSETPQIIKTIERWMVQWSLVLEASNDERFRMSQRDIDVAGKRYEQATKWLMGIVDDDIPLLKADGTAIVPKLLEEDEETFIGLEVSRFDENGSAV